MESFRVLYIVSLCLSVFSFFCPDLSLIVNFRSYLSILIHWNLLSKLNINVASKYSPNRWRSCHRYFLYQLLCNIINVYAYSICVDCSFLTSKINDLATWDLKNSLIEKTPKKSVSAQLSELVTLFQKCKS